MLNAFQGEEHQPFTLTSGRPAALLVHGFPGTPAEMRPLAEVLHSAGWTAHGLLLPGFGAEIEYITRYKQEDWVRTVEHKLHQLQQNHKPVLLIGHSMGAALSIQVAAKTKVDGLVVFAPFWKLNHVLWRSLPVLKFVFPQPQLFKWFKLNFDDPEVQAGIHNFMPDADLSDPQVRKEILEFRLPVTMFAQIHRAGHAAHQAAPQVKAQTLVIQGNHDELVLPSLTRQMAARLKAAYTELPGDHNLPQIIQQRPDLQTAVLQFARQFEPETSMG